MKHWKAMLFVAVELILIQLVFVGVIAVDYAETKFWWNAWILISVLSGIGFIYGIFWLVKNNKQW